MRGVSGCLCDWLTLAYPAALELCKSMAITPGKGRGPSLSRMASATLAKKLEVKLQTFKLSISSYLNLWTMKFQPFALV